MKSLMVFLLSIFIFVEPESSEHFQANSCQKHALGAADTLPRTLFYTVQGHKANKLDGQFAVLYLHENSLNPNLQYDNDEVRVGLTAGTFQPSVDMPVWPSSDLTNLAVAGVKNKPRPSLKGHSEYLWLQKLMPMMRFYEEKHQNPCPSYVILVTKLAPCHKAKDPSKPIVGCTSEPNICKESKDKWTIKYTTDTTGEKIVNEVGKIKSLLREAKIAHIEKAVTNHPWLGHITNKGWEAKDQIRGFPWLNCWKGCSTDIVTDMEEIVQQLIPTRVYYSLKLGQDVTTNLCRLCGSKPKTVSHILTGCPLFSQTEYSYRHNNVYKCLYFTIPQQFGNIKTIPSPNADVELKPVMKTADLEVFLDIPIYSFGPELPTTAEQGNRPDMVVVNYRSKTVAVFECSCPWITNMEKKDKEKTDKYQEVRVELQRKYENYDVYQITVLLDALGGYLKCSKTLLNELLQQDKLVERF